MQLTSGGFSENIQEVNVLKEEFLLRLNAPPAREKLDQFIHVYSTPHHDLSPEKMITDLIHVLNSSSTTNSAWANRKNKNTKWYTKVKQIRPRGTWTNAKHLKGVLTELRRNK